jgi:hypothetical protein
MTDACVSYPRFSPYCAPALSRPGTRQAGEYATVLSMPARRKDAGGERCLQQQQQQLSARCGSSAASPPVIMLKADMRRVMTGGYGMGKRDRMM